METFGSDADPPNVNSVKRVRKSDIFIGIYAHRYGSVHEESGESLTELELDEAKRAFGSGLLSNIFLYMIDLDSKWLAEHKETNESSRAGLQRLKEKAQKHTYTFFISKEDLIYKIMRNVYREVSEKFPSLPLKVRPIQLPSQKSLREPFGMEYLKSEDSQYLVGRQNEVAQLTHLLEEETIVLLLGDSGIGKTSLIHAGLIPEAMKRGFRPVYTRSWGLPFTDLTRQITNSVFMGHTPYKGSLVPILAEVTGALGDERVLVIIDQFEDVLIARDMMETGRLVSELRALRELGIPSLRILITYRADLEGRLGEYWQQISGAPCGLPRVYIGGVNEDQAWNGVRQATQDLSVTIELRAIEQKRLKDDLIAASKPFGFSGVYPPHIQMLISHIWLSSEKGKVKYNLKKYQEVGGMEGVIGGYLGRQLEYARDNKGHVRAVLISLVRSYGTRDQRSIEEIAADTALGRDDCEIAVEKLIDLRLVRHVGDFYEVTHDFIARRIIAELVDSEEREFKRFRELLSSKAAAYQTTQARLTSEELLILYKHRSRVVPSDQELRLLLASWIEGTGPALYWLLSAIEHKVIEWLRSEESKEELSGDEKVPIILLRRKLGESGSLTEDYSVFGGYQLSAEMSYLIEEEAPSTSKKVLMYGLRHRRAEVTEASKAAIALQITNGDFGWIEQLRNSSSLACQRAYYELVFCESVPMLDEEAAKTAASREFNLLKKMAVVQSPSEARQLLRQLQKARPPARSLLFGRSLALVREGRIQELIKRVRQVSKEEAALMLAGIGKEISAKLFDAVVTEYEGWNSQEKGRYERPAVYAKANAYATTILCSSSEEGLQRLRQAMKRIELTPSSRAIVLALSKYGDVGDVEYLLGRIAAEEKEIEFWNHTELGRCVARRMEELGGGMPASLKEIQNKPEFWEYIPAEERANRPESDLLGLKNSSNKALYIRFASYAMIGAAEEQDQDLLLRLTNHDYGLIARAASIRLVRLLKEAAINLMSTKIDDSIQKGNPKSLAEALRAAEIELYDVARLW